MTNLGQPPMLTPMEAHRDKIRKCMGIEAVFTKSIIEYHIHDETVYVV